MEKIISFFKRLKYRWSLSRCYNQQENEANAIMGCCRGLVGGDSLTGYLQYECIDCPYLVNLKKGHKYMKFIDLIAVGVQIVTDMPTGEPLTQVFTFTRGTDHFQYIVNYYEFLSAQRDKMYDLEGNICSLVKKKLHITDRDFVSYPEWAASRAKGNDVNSRPFINFYK